MLGKLLAHIPKSAPAQSLPVISFSCILVALAAACSNEPSEQLAGADPAAPTQVAGTEAPAGPFVLLMEVISETDGWALTDQALVLTQDGARSWVDVTPRDVPLASIRGVDFVDRQHGWAAAWSSSRGAEPDQLIVARTSDGGLTWQSAVLATPTMADNLSPGGAAYVSFLDQERGWVVWRSATSTQFSLGVLFRTLDGGATWERLNVPLGEPVAFANEKDGFVAGGPAGDKAFATHDGGTTWEPVNLDIPAELASTHPAFGTPVFFSAQEGVLPVSFNSAQSAFGFYSTSDSGRTWKLTGVTTTGESLGMGSLAPASAMNASMVIHVSGDGGKVFSTVDKGANWSILSPNGLPPGLGKVDFVTREIGWALVQTNGCLSFKSDCFQRQDIYKTSDGGQTWTKVNLTAPGG